MSSPFKTFQEFSEAEGPIYTFANNSAMIGFLISLTALILLYFIYMSYAMKQDSAAKSPAALGAIILAGALSLAGLSHSQSPKQMPETARRQPTSELSLRPLALIGMIGVGAKAFKSRHRSAKRSSRFSSRYRSR